MANKKTKKQKTSEGNKIVEWVKAHKVATVVIVVVILLVGIGAGGMTQTKNNGESKLTDSSKEAKNKSDEKKDPRITIDESEAEQYCQDANLLGKYIDLNNYKVISVLDYNKQYGAFGGWYDGDGKDILYLRWNGKNKVTDSPVRFDCWISGTNDKIQLHRLVIDDNTVFDIAPTTVVDKDGNHMF